MPYSTLKWYVHLPNAWIAWIWSLLVPWVTRLLSALCEPDRNGLTQTLKTRPDSFIPYTKKLHSSTTQISMHCWCLRTKTSPCSIVLRNEPSAAVQEEYRDSKYSGPLNKCCDKNNYIYQWAIRKSTYVSLIHHIPSRLSSCRSSTSVRYWK